MDCISLDHHSERRCSATILLAEDELIMRKMVRTILERNGFNVLTASNGVGALTICEGYEGPIHLLLTDVMMPIMNGRDLARRFSLIRPGTRVVFMSGYPEEDLGLEPEEFYIQKPFSGKALVRTIMDALDNHH